MIDKVLDIISDELKQLDMHSLVASAKFEALAGLRKKVIELKKQDPIHAVVSMPSIAIDKDAIRFDYGDSTTNLFFGDLFRGGKIGRTFQDEIMTNIHLIYLARISEDALLGVNEDVKGLAL